MAGETGMVLKMVLLKPINGIDGSSKSCVLPLAHLSKMGNI